jgi:quercetin dioxygenase-like cupin family protein
MSMTKIHPLAATGLILPDALGSNAVSEPEPGLEREILVHSPALMLIRHRMRKGWRGSAHRHPHEQLVYILSGRIEIAVNGVVHEASSGDNFIVASNAEHQAIALEDSVVLDIFTPPREDYL